MSAVTSGFTAVRAPMFSGLPPAPRNRWRYFTYAIILQTFLVAILIHLGVIRPETIIPKKYQFIALQAPVPINHAPQRIPPRVMVRAPRIQMQRPPVVAKLETPPPPPKIETPAPPKPVISEVKPVIPEVKPQVKTGAFASAANEKPSPKPIPQVKTGAFSTGSSATPTVIADAHKVQTGGFGDPNGVPANSHSHGPANIAKVGSFDLPSGPGYGNGTGGAIGARAVVASAGFGNGIAVGGGGHGNGAAGRVVSDAGFGDSAPVREVAQVHHADAPTPQQPVQIEYKPVPAYTAEARQMHLEGEVLLEVTFTADGRVQVRRVVRGLGHGLDEQAVKAAEQIRFKPATRAGAPVDSTAVLHIVFQMA